MIDFHSACRICLKDDAAYPIFENIEGIQSIYTKLPQCLKEKVEDIKDYPRHICIECKDTIDTISIFLNKLEETCNILKRKIVTVKTELVDCCDVSNEDLYESELLPLEKINRINKVEHEIEVKKDPTELLGSLKHLTVKILKIENNFGSQDSNDIRNENVKKKKKDLPAKPKKVINKAKQQPKKNSTKTIKSAAKSITKKPLRVVKQDTIQIETEKLNKADVTTPILCDLCGATFCSTMKLKYHNRKVHLEKKYKCTKCTTSCRYAKELEQHILSTHEKVRNYICDQCGKGFTLNKILIGHIKVVHDKIKRISTKIYKCKFCERSYTYKRGVVIHERSVHTGERPSICSVCSSSFYDSVYLAEHMRLHTGATPHKCPVCGRGYAQRGNMKSHMRNHKISELDAETLSKVKPNYHKFMRP